MRYDPLFLAATVMASVLLFGSVEPWAAGLIGLAVTVYFNIRVHDARFLDGMGRPSKGPRWKKEIIWGKESGPRIPWRVFAFSWRGGMLISAAGFMAVSLLGLAPLPVRTIAFFSKKGYGLIEGLSLQPPAWHTLSLDGHQSVEALLRLAICAMVFIIAERAGRDRKALKRTFSILSFFGFGLVVFAVIQKSTWDGRLYWFRALRYGRHPFGPFVNRNHFAGFMGMLIPPGLALAFEARRPAKTVLYALLAAVMAAGLFYSLSRGGIISFFASMLVFLAMARPKSGRPGNRAVYYAVFCFFAIALLFYVFYGGISPLLGRFEEGGLSFGTRLKVWEAALRAAWDFKWFGTGLGTFREIFPLYNPGLQKTFDFAHNDYINLVVETGLWGFFFLLVFFASFARGVYNYYGRQKPSYLTAGLLASVAYMLVHSFLDFNLHIPSNAITFSVVAGFATARIHLRGGGARPGGREDFDGTSACPNGKRIY